MTVWVDDMHKFAMGQFGRMKMSHLMADTDDELHAMAARIGVARRWFQGDHYDVAMSKRAQAIEFGAVAITLREMAAYAWFKRVKKEVLTPAEAVKRRYDIVRENASDPISEVIDGA